MAVFRPSSIPLVLLLALSTPASVSGFQGPVAFSTRNRSAPQSSTRLNGLEETATSITAAIVQIPNAVGQLPASISQLPTAAGVAIDTFFQTKPYLSAFLTCSVKASAADLVAQSKQVDEETAVAEEEMFKLIEDIDFQRNLAFIVYGGTYQGLFQEFLYGTIFPAWFGTDITVKTVFQQVFTDMTLFAPLLCLPCAYIIKSAIASDEVSLNSVKKSLDKYREDIFDRGLLFKFWSVWVPADCLTFSVIPPHYRIAFVALVSFFWMFLLSTIANDDTPKEA